jgi:hypothetical protein
LVVGVRIGPREPEPGDSIGPVAKFWGWGGGGSKGWDLGASYDVPPLSKDGQS